MKRIILVCAILTLSLARPDAAKAIGEASVPQKSANVGWVFTKMKSDKIYERFSACGKEKASFEGHLKGESDMWSSRGAVCAASHFFEDKEFIFECKYPRLGNSTRYYFWHDSKAKCEARLTQVKGRWKKEKLD